jgi:hypothetical protein
MMYAVNALTDRLNFLTCQTTDLVDRERVEWSVPHLHNADPGSAEARALMF